MSEGGPTTVWVDGGAFENRTQVGIWRVFYEVLSRVPANFHAVLWLRSQPVQPIAAGAHLVRDRARAPLGRANVLDRVRRKWARRVLPAGLKRAGVFHATYFTPCPTPGPAVVVTIYDMIAENRCVVDEKWESQILVKRDAILGATRLITISATTAAELIRFYPEVRDRVRVVPLGAEHLSLDNGAPPAYRGSDPAAKYALYVGMRGDYKNFSIVLDAMLHPSWPTEVLLHVVGPPMTDCETRLIEAHGLLDRIRSLGRLSDADLRDQYVGARCFLYPSLMEGFGIPVLEAQACGCPAVLSDIPCFREVAGDAAVFFDPRLSERLAEAVAMVGEPDVRRRVIEAGFANIRRFSWDKTAEQTFQVYSEAARAVGRGG